MREKVIEETVAPLSIESQLTSEAREGLSHLTAISSHCPRSWITREREYSPPPSEGGPPVFYRDYEATLGGVPCEVVGTWKGQEVSFDSLDELTIEDEYTHVSYSLSLNHGKLSRVVVHHPPEVYGEKAVVAYDSDKDGFTPAINDFLASLSQVEEYGRRVDEYEASRIREELEESGHTLREVLAENDTGIAADVVLSTLDGSPDGIRRYQLTTEKGDVVGIIETRTPSGRALEYEVANAARNLLDKRRIAPESLSTISPDVAKETGSIETVYSEQERNLGVAVSRDLIREQGRDEQEAWATYRGAPHASVYLSVEGDPLLQGFLGELKDRVRGAGSNELLDGIELARVVTSAVVEMTPVVDDDDTFHPVTGVRQVSLGEALTQPVQCYDRAIAMEAGLAMAGIDDCNLLQCEDRIEGTDGSSVVDNHVDVEIRIDDGEFVTITMGDKAGEILTREQYERDYIPERLTKGLGARRILGKLPKIFESVGG